MAVELWKSIDERLKNSDIQGAIDSLESLLQAEDTGRFKGLIGARFTNDPADILTRINGFILECGNESDVQAVYLEMNGFDINYDRWFFDFFGYSEFENDPSKQDWLCDWQYEGWPSVDLIGLESIQAEFQWYQEKRIWKDESYKQTYELALLLVMVKFIALIESALQSGELAKPIPVLATAHEFEMLGRFETA